MNTNGRHHRHIGHNFHSSPRAATNPSRPTTYYHGGQTASSYSRGSYTQPGSALRNSNNRPTAASQIHARGVSRHASMAISTLPNPEDEGCGRRGERTPAADLNASREYQRRYTEEQYDFIWYLKIDLQQSWAKIVSDCMVEFPGVTRTEHRLQSTYYRHMSEQGILSSRTCKSRGQRYADNSMSNNTLRRYPWPNGS